ncbi:hypothetical protein H5J25_05400 [Sphingomonas aliaeris]|uniref:DUF6894 domain-containing protein n=1 Tax=Sphingomonas aliaeris TaxID=2759526 RepID=A0A974NW51_9SPHN|nr:hypothetical protein [Sphingomonas aliaeris]QQV78154.1 hypothetical protein H5J25_05400 [Sphingomonas aliaeris]
MHRYFFHLIERGQFIEDLEGLMLADEESAIEEAKRNARGIVAHEIRDTGTASLDRAIEIVAETGDFRFRVPFDAALSIRS